MVALSDPLIKGRPWMIPAEELSPRSAVDDAMTRPTTKATIATRPLRVSAVLNTAHRAGSTRDCSCGPGFEPLRGRTLRSPMARAPCT